MATCMYLVKKRYDANISLCQGSHNPCVPAKVTFPNHSLYSPYRTIHMRKTERCELIMERLGTLRVNTDLLT